MGDISLFESPRKYVGIVARLGILEGIVSKRRIKLRRKIMILMMSLKNNLKRMVEMPLLQLWQHV